MKLTTGLGASALAIAVSLGASAMAETTMRFSDYLPATHYLTMEGSMPFMNAVKEATNGEVTFQHFPAQQLGKSTDFLRLTAGNVAQISVVGVSFVADKMELSNVAQMPGVFEKACDGLEAYNQILDTTPLRDKDFTQHGVKLLMSYVLPPFELASSKKDVETIADMKGMKILVASRATELLMNQIGAAPIQATSGAAAYEQVERGTIDGLIFAPDSILTYDLHTVTKNGTTNGNFGGQVVAVIMNQGAYDELDDATKAIFDEAAAKAEQRVCEYVDTKKVEALAKIEAHGNELTTFSNDQLAILGEASQKVADGWAAELDSRGVAGSDTLKAFQNALQD